MATEHQCKIQHELIYHITELGAACEALRNMVYAKEADGFDEEERFTSCVPTARAAWAKNEDIIMDGASILRLLTKREGRKKEEAEEVRGN